MTVSFYIAIIFFFAGFIQGLSGSGSSLVALPLLCLLINIKTAVPLVVLFSLIITTIMVIQLKQHAAPRKIIPLCISSIPGVVVGTTLLKSADSDIIGFMLGSLLGLYCVYSLACHPKPRSLSRLWGFL
jgi:uncharacterized membrane protein YfcA